MDMSYEDAYNQLQLGEQIARRVWKSTPIVIYTDADAVCCRDIQGKLIPGWVPSESDELAEDWYVVTENRVELGS